MSKTLLATFAARFALPLYFAVTFGFAWGCWGLVAVARRAALPPSVADALQIVGAFAPLLAALTVTALQGTTRDFLARGVRPKVELRWVGFVVFAPAALMLAAIALTVEWGTPTPKFPSLWQWPMVAINFVAVLLVGGPLGEEFGWRGFALPIMQTRFGAVRSNVALGAIWALWHLPLFWMTGTAQSQLPFGLFFALTIALSVIYTWLFNNTEGSVLLAMLFHASINTWSGPLRILPTATHSLRPYQITAVLVCAAALVLVVTGRVRRKTTG